MIRYGGKQIVLRDWQLKDADDYIFWRQPGQAWQKFDGPYYSRESREEVVQVVHDLCDKIRTNTLDEPREDLAIVDRKTDKLLGRVGWYWESKETNWLCASICARGRGISA